MRADAAEAMDAAIRQGAALARHLLSLGRRTVRTLAPVRLADVVDSSVKALRRVLPEDVELKAIREGDAWIDADETEIQRVLRAAVRPARILVLEDHEPVRRAHSPPAATAAVRRNSVGDRPVRFRKNAENWLGLA